MNQNVIGHFAPEIEHPVEAEGRGLGDAALVGKLFCNRGRGETDLELLFEDGTIDTADQLIFVHVGLELEPGLGNGFEEPF